MSVSITASSKSIRRAPRRRGVSLRLRLVLLVLLIAVPVVALVNILITARANELLTEDAKQQLLLVNRALSANAQAWLDSHRQALQAMVSLPETARIPGSRSPSCKR
jgi:sensor histidine kinase regulating citrate/malate metabolism